MAGRLDPPVRFSPHEIAQAGEELEEDRGGVGFRMRLDGPHDRRTAPRLTSPPRHGKRLVPATDAPRTPFTPQQRLLILDSLSRSGLPAGDFAPLVGLSKHTLYAWHRKFQQDGPAGLEDKPRGAPAGLTSSFAQHPAVRLLAEANEQGVADPQRGRPQVAGRPQ